MTPSIHDRSHDIRSSSTAARSAAARADVMRERDAHEAPTAPSDDGPPRAESASFAADARLAALVGDHSARLLNIARRYLDEDEARDAVQETLIKAWRHIDGFRARAELSTWLHRVTVNTCIDRLRRLASRREMSLETLTANALETSLATVRDSIGPERHLERVELERLCRRCILQMPTDYRTIVMLRDVEGFSGEESARMLGISTNLVKVRLHRARRVLRDLLSPYVQP